MALDTWNDAASGKGMTSSMRGTPTTFDLADLPPLPETSAAEEVFLGMLPPLPPSTDSEMDELSKPSSEPSVWPKNDKNLRLPPFPNFNYYQARDSVKYYELNYNNELTLAYDKGRSVYIVREFLNHMYCLRRHLRENLRALNEFGEEALSVRPNINFANDTEDGKPTASETAQVSFSAHHIGISECLKNLRSGCGRFGLHSYSAYNNSRNFFAHDFGTPKVACPRAFRNMATEVVGKQKLYEPLYLHVKASIKLFEEQLKDLDNWADEYKAPDPNDWFSTHSTDYPVANPRYIEVATPWLEEEDPPWVQEQLRQQAAWEAQRRDTGGWTSPVKFIYFRVKVVRWVWNKVWDYLHTKVLEYGNYEVALEEDKEHMSSCNDGGEEEEKEEKDDEGYASREVSAEETDWDLPEDMPYTYAAAGRADAW